MLHYLRVTTTYFAAFFPKGVRANNTSIHSAMTAGAVVVTNLDEDSPEGYKHMDTVIDIDRCAALPTDAKLLQEIGDGAQAEARQFGWPALADLLEKDEMASARPRTWQPRSLTRPAVAAGKTS